MTAPCMPHAPLGPFSVALKQANTAALITPGPLHEVTSYRSHQTSPIHTSRQVPDLVDSYMKGETRLDKYVTHNLKFDQINEAFELLHSGESLRTVLTF